MRLYSASSSRTTTLDRNPLRLVGGNQGTSSGSGVTTRLSYTVPAGRKAIVTAHASGTVIVAFTGADTANVRVTVNPSGLTVPFLLFVGAPGIGVRLDVVLPEWYLTAGDTLAFVVDTAMPGTGQLTHSVGYAGYEYDA